MWRRTRWSNTTVDGNLFIKRVTLRYYSSCATIELLMMETLVSLVYFFFPALTRPEPPVYHWKIMRALMNGSSENTTVDQSCLCGQMEFSMLLHTHRQSSFLASQRWNTEARTHEESTLLFLFSVFSTGFVALIVRVGGDPKKQVELHKMYRVRIPLK